MTIFKVHKQKCNIPFVLLVRCCKYEGVCKISGNSYIDHLAVWSPWSSQFPQYPEYLRVNCGETKRYVITKTDCVGSSIMELEPKIDFSLITITIVICRGLKDSPFYIFNSNFEGCHLWGKMALCNF